MLIRVESVICNFGESGWLKNKIKIRVGMLMLASSMGIDVEMHVDHITIIPYPNWSFHHMEQVRVARDVCVNFKGLGLGLVHLFK